MALQSLPPSAEEYAASNTREIGAAVAAVERVWSRMDSADFDGSYAALEPTLLAVLDTAQERASAAATAYVPQVMVDLGLPLPAAAYRLRPGALVGTTGDGLTTEGLAYRAVIGAKRAVAGGLDPAAALAQSGRFLTSATGTLLSDTGRSAERVAGGARGVDVWVRMLTPPSCGRCVILAGQFSGREPFLRHPRCDCRAIPMSENVAGDLLTDPHAYFDGLDDAALARVLGSKANAEAFRMGADQYQLVNAYRRGVRSAQVYGRNVKYTTEGTTRRGLAYSRMRQAGYVRAQGEAKVGRYMALRAPRLMPESIFQIATDPADAQRLLRLYGWIL